MREKKLAGRFFAHSKASLQTKTSRSSSENISATRIRSLKRVLTISVVKLAENRAVENYFRRKSITAIHCEHSAAGRQPRKGVTAVWLTTSRRCPAFPPGFSGSEIKFSVQFSGSGIRFPSGLPVSESGFPSGFAPIKPREKPHPSPLRNGKNRVENHAHCRCKPEKTG